jgi:hypothetical protein
MVHSHHSSQAWPQSRSQLIVDDLSAQLAPLDTYGLADIGSTVVDGLVALAGASSKRLHALRAPSIDERSACRAAGSVEERQRPGWNCCV